MVALILAMTMQQAATAATFTVSVNVVRTSCVVVSAEGAASWSVGRRPGPDAVQCTRSAIESLPPPRLATVAETVEGSERRTVEIQY
jgi:hypothetical protein